MASVAVEMSGTGGTIPNPGVFNPGSPLRNFSHALGVLIIENTSPAYMGVKV